MMYLNDKDGFIRDFSARTKKLIKNFEVMGDSDYEVTLLCNCMLGMLVFPKEKLGKYIRTISLSDKNQQKLTKGLSVKNNSNDLAEIFRRMKNAVSHCNIMFKGDSNNTIKYICFYDDKDHGSEKALKTYEFQLELDVTDLKDILIDFCDKLSATKNKGGV